MTPDRIRRAHAHAALLAARYGETHPSLVLVFERLEQAVAELDQRGDALARARAVAARRAA